MRIRRPSNAYCARSRVSICSRWSQTGASGTPLLLMILRSDHPESQREGVLFLPAPFLWRPLGELYDSVRRGEPAFPRVFGQKFFEYLADCPEDAATFNKVMTQGIAWTTPALLAAYDFSQF